MCTFLMLVLGEIHLLADEILQPPGYAIQQVLQVHTHEVPTLLVYTESSIEVAVS
jgi:hypothetical protein